MRINGPWHHRTLVVLVITAATASGPLSVFAEVEQVDVFVSGQGGYHTYRIPAVVVTTKGTLLAFCEGRKVNRRDAGDIDLLLRRSTDGGKTWQPKQLVHEEGGTAKITIGNPCPIIERKTGKVVLLLSRNNQRAFMTSSTDEGKTWTKPVEITERFKAFDFNWTRLATGPGHGIQLHSGPHAGRLVAPVWLNERKGGQYRSAVMLSDDGGKTWRAGGIAPPLSPKQNECMVAETTGGRLYLSMRATPVKQRTIAWSDDGGRTWSQPKRVSLVGPVCQASVLGIRAKGGEPTDRLLFANPASQSREKMTVRLSEDAGQTWPRQRVLHAGPSAYSDLCALPDGWYGCLFEFGKKQPYERLAFVRFGLDDLKARSRR